MADLEKMAQDIFDGKAADVRAATEAAIAEGIPPEKILAEGLIKGMNAVGIKFKANEIYVPEVLIAARAMKAGMELLKPALAAGGIEPKGTVVMGTVKGDMHDIGKNLVSMMLEGAGYKIIDIGVDQPPEKFIEAAKNGNAKVIGISALLTTTMLKMKETIDAMNAEGLVPSVKVIIGGAPVTEDFAKEIGADGYAPDAASAVDVVDKLIAV
jgi:5-methyltetrahydrofolate--homocysteine methyltransferase